MPERFNDDDDGYLRWIETHPRGYVINTSPRPSADYVILHRASCGTITGTPSSGDSWTGIYMKVCDTDKQRLVGWSRASVGSEPQLCRLCHP